MSRSRTGRSAPSKSDDFFDDDDDDFSPSAQAEQSERLKQLATDLLDRWHWIALGLVLGILGALYFLSKAPTVYKSTASILVRQQTSSLLTRDQVEEIDLRSVEALNTVAERLKRPELILNVASDPTVRALPNLMQPPVNWLPEWSHGWMGIEPVQLPIPPPSPEELAVEIRKWMTVAVRRQTRLLDLTISHRDPAVAKALTDAIAIQYESELSGARADGRNSSQEIFVTQADEARNQLQNAQNALANYQRALQTLQDLNTRENTLTELSRRYRSKHPRMVAATNDFNAYMERFLAEFESVRKAAVDRKYWEEHENEGITPDIDPKERLDSSRRLLVARAAVLENEIQSQTSVYNNLLTRIQESGINQQATESEVEISSRGLLPDKPASPRKAIVLAGGLVLGLGMGTALALLLVRLDNKYHTVIQVERDTEVPVLSAVGVLDPKILDKIARKNLSPKPNKSNSLRERWSPQLVFREGLTDTLYAEAFRILRASVSLLGDETNRKITLFSSALPGEGKTLISSNFALAAAQGGKKVLLIDLDLRKPSTHKNFGLKRDTHGSGSTEILAGQSSWQDAIYKDTGSPNLHLILSGKRAPNPGELLNPAKLEKLLHDLSEHYDHIVIDSAPLLAVPDTRLILPFVDNFCLVVRAEYVPRGAVRRVLSTLALDKRAPSGLILNSLVEKRRLIGQNYSYGNYQGGRYGYGNYGSYGSDKDD